MFKYYWNYEGEWRRQDNEKFADTYYLESNGDLASYHPYEGGSFSDCEWELSTGKYLLATSTGAKDKNDKDLIYYDVVQILHEDGSFYLSPTVIKDIDDLYELIHHVKTTSLQFEIIGDISTVDKFKNGKYTVIVEKEDDGEIKKQSEIEKLLINRLAGMLNKSDSK
jgi:hypothetical protein